jgi:hypothetical protein
MKRVAISHPDAGRGVFLKTCAASYSRRITVIGILTHRTIFRNLRGKCREVNHATPYYQY